MTGFLRKFIVLSLLLLLPALIAGAQEQSPRMIRVGAFNYYPAIFQDSDGVVKGFYVDLLDDIARQENLRIDYIYGSWDDGLERIQNGEVDVLTSVARTPERAAYMDYTRTPLLTVWGELYVPKGSGIDSLLKVQGKTIAVMKSDFNGAHFIDLVKKFDIRCDFLEVPSFDAVFSAIAEGRADAGVASSTFGVPKQREYGLRTTGVVFNPFDIYFSVAKGMNQDLLALLDGYLEKSRQDENSVYLSAQRKWSHGGSHTVQVLPRWLIFSAGGFALLFLVAGVFVVLLRKKVAIATSAILEREAALRENSEMIQLLLNSTAEAICGIDLQGNCTFCNAASLRLLGYERQEQLIGRSLHSLTHPKRAEGVSLGIGDCAFFENLLRHEEIHGEEEFWRADGYSFPVEYWSYPIVRNDEIIGTVVTFVDITARRQAEKSLKEKSAELERFTYTVSHDLNSPLVTIKSFLAFLEQDLANQDATQISKDFNYIRLAADKMGQLLSELLEFSRIGRKSNQPTRFTFQEMLKDVMTVTAGSVVDRGVMVKVAAADLTLIGDRVRLAGIWQNLVDNAVKFMGEQESPRLEIGVEVGMPTPVFYVRDNGMGIDPAYHEKVFGFFERLDSSTKGTGLGLAVVKRIVELNGGKIWVESDGHGSGSCFRFTLPLAIGEPEGV